MSEPAFYRFVIDRQVQFRAIARLLGAHRMTTGNTADVYCTCGWHGRSDGPGRRRATHDMHAAEVIDLFVSGRVPR